jgi:hypothetical protein
MRILTCAAVILIAVCCLYLPAVNAAPQAIALGPRPAIKADPIMIPDEEALGQNMDNVVEPPAEDPIEVNRPEIQVPPEAEVEVIDRKGRPIEVHKPVRSKNKPALQVQDRQTEQEVFVQTMAELAAKTMEYGKNAKLPKEKCHTETLPHKQVSFKAVMCYNGFCTKETICNNLPGCKGDPEKQMGEVEIKGVKYFKGCKLGTTKPADAEDTGKKKGDKPNEDPADPNKPVEPKNSASSFGTAYLWVGVLVIVIL